MGLVCCVTAESWEGIEMVPLHPAAELIRPRVSVGTFSPKTEHEPNRIVGSSFFWFGFGFQFCEVRFFGSVSVSMPYRTEKPKYRETYFFPCCLSKLMEYCGLLSRMNCKFVIFDLSIELLSL